MAKEKKPTIKRCRNCDNCVHPNFLSQTHQGGNNPSYCSITTKKVKPNHCCKKHKFAKGIIGIIGGKESAKQSSSSSKE